MTPKLFEYKRKTPVAYYPGIKGDIFEKAAKPSFIQDIVYETKRSRGWVYLYFANKKDVWVAILMKMKRSQRDVLKVFLHTIIRLKGVGVLLSGIFQAV